MIPYFLSENDCAIVTMDKFSRPEEVHLTLSGDPRPQGCPRYSVRGGRIIIYNPDTPSLRLFRRVVREALGTSARSFVFPETAYCQVDVTIEIRRPPSHYTRAGKLRAGMPLFPTAGGDIDNYDKFVLDGLQGVVYADDRMVAILYSTKKWSSTNQGKTIITVQKLN